MLFRKNMTQEKREQLAKKAYEESQTAIAALERFYTRTTDYLDHEVITWLKKNNIVDMVIDWNGTTLDEHNKWIIPAHDKHGSYYFFIDDNGNLKLRSTEKH